MLRNRACSRRQCPCRTPEFPRDLGNLLLHKVQPAQLHQLPARWWSRPPARWSQSWARSHGPSPTCPPQWCPHPSTPQSLGRSLSPPPQWSRAQTRPELELRPCWGQVSCHRPPYWLQSWCRHSVVGASSSEETRDQVDLTETELMSRPGHPIGSCLRSGAYLCDQSTEGCQNIFKKKSLQ